jgi:hypothetical protein
MKGELMSTTLIPDHILQIGVGFFVSTSEP